ncbi:MAG: hypothetical protein JSS56_08865 [Proteobacteria bacterium]|nr:hypothetical protein [Pseudomonadota bacterium]
MSSGRQLGEKNAQTFIAWAASKTDSDFRAMTIRGVLARKEVAKECGFAKSALDQNPRIKEALRDLEDDLRLRGVLPPLAVPDPAVPQSSLMREPSRLRAAQETERLRRLEQENAGLKAEVAELKRALEKHVVLREALALTGRLPR